MQKPRSYSFDDSVYPSTLTEQEESALEKELAEKIAARKTREKKEGYFYIRESSWINMCCGVFPGSWSKRYGKLTADKIILKSDEQGSEIGVIALKGSKLLLTEIIGHNGKHNCLKLTSFGYETYLSYENNEDLREWAISLTYVIESLEKQTSFFNI